MFHVLRSHHFHVGHTQNQIGKACFETSDHDDTKQKLERAPKLEPHRTQAFGMLSAVMLHLQLEIDLNALVHRTASIDKISPCA